MQIVGRSVAGGFEKNAEPWRSLGSAGYASAGDAPSHFESYADGAAKSNTSAGVNTRVVTTPNRSPASAPPWIGGILTGRPASAAAIPRRSRRLATQPRYAKIPGLCS